MSRVAVSYSSLANSSARAKHLSEKYNTYANNLRNQVYNKLSSYSGQRTGHITDAQSKVNSKINDLRSASNKYSKYSKELSDLKQNCTRTDKAVKSKVSSLTAAFKKKNKIKTGKVEEFCNRFGVGLANSGSAGRWISDKYDEANTGLNYVKDRIKRWYNYEGGKEFLKGMLTFLAEFAIGVLTIVGAILTGGALLVVIAAVVGGALMIINAGVNYWNECKAYDARQNGDPALGKRYSAEDTLQDTLRKETDSQFWHNVATGIDVVDTVCTVITVASSVGKTWQGFTKWKEAHNIKHIFSKSTFKLIGGKLSNFGKAIKAKDFSEIKQLGSDFMKNLKHEYFNVNSSKDLFRNLSKANFAKGVKSMKNCFSFGKSVVSVAFGDMSIPKMAFEKIFAPGTTIASGEGIKGVDNITIDSVKGPIDKIGKAWDTATSNYETKINSSVLDKLSNPCKVDIHVPQIKYPHFNINQFRMAS